MSGSSTASALPLSSSSPIARVAHKILTYVCTSLLCIATATVLAWIIGRVLTDRYHWSQWLWWLPTPLIFSIVVLGLSASAGAAVSRRVRRRIAMAGIVIAAAIATYFALIEHQMLRKTPTVPSSKSSIKLMHWNAQPPRWIDVAPTIDVMKQTQADLIILTDPGGPLNHERSVELTNDGYRIVGAQPFAIASRLPVITFRSCVTVDRMCVSLLEVDATERLGRVIVIYLVDLPSQTGIARMQLVARLRGMLDKLSLPKPDVVVGDFNIPRGSASIVTLFPELRHAYDVAGHGHGATYPRIVPLWHIDHVLFAPTVTVTRYDIDDPGISRHRSQTAWISNDH